MADSILLDGDTVRISSQFGIAFVIIAQQGRLTASGGDPINGRRMCVQGDEGSVLLASCAYTTPMCPIPGFGNVTIARFQVITPAMMTMPTGQQVPDTCMIYNGTGSFVSIGLTKQGE